ncbi:Oidioi.mRNA.OKI2018_I69.chr2.g4333.t1.cds [Oikopleura dioica]|uniref:Oidioi.mRNA.OKI2018_I69.chr2.g4333.t1.cds n=1 Tax=Oikopleura dioica TaxID=34765 RepID=A0ABN7SWS1_OIKDI|nr:Oidioi.mRNA.OKI2018_I69.chr2.g4333.t1.cds [Oikopleura dioica]
MALELKNLKKLLTDPKIHTFLLFSVIFCGGLFLIGLQVYRSRDSIGLECEITQLNPNITDRIHADRIYCEETMMANLREFVDNMRENNHSWCDFHHHNVGHHKTSDKSETHACFPSVPAGMEIEVTCPMNSTAFYWDRPQKTVKRECNNNGTWNAPEGHCGCHYDVLKWDRIAYYFSGFQKFKVMLVLFSATSLIFGAFILRLNSLHCTRNSIHLNLFSACLLYNIVDLVVFFFAIAISTSPPEEETNEQSEFVGKRLQKLLCRGKDTMTIYSLLAIYTWVLIEANIFEPSKIVANVLYRHEESVCWDSNMVEPENRWIGWIYDVPKKILLLAATVFFFSVLRILWSKLSTTQKLTTLTQSAQENRGADVTGNLPKLTQIVRASIILVIVYGIWDFKELFLHQDEFSPETLGWWIVMLIDILIDSIRGFFIASVYCFSNTEVRQELTRWYRRRCVSNELRRARQSGQYAGMRLSRRPSQLSRDPSTFETRLPQNSVISNTVDSSDPEGADGSRHPKLMTGRSTESRDNSTFSAVSSN